MTSSNAMRQLEERHVATKVELMVWSNKMDLLALSNVRGRLLQVYIHCTFFFCHNLLTPCIRLNT